MKLKLYSKLLDSLLRLNRFNGLYLKIWRLYHIEKGNVYRAGKNNQ